jgi:hypothetical protein
LRRDHGINSNNGGQHEHHRPGDGLGHFIVSDDVERSRRFYTDVLGGKTVISGEAGDEVTYVALANIRHRA